LPPDVAADFPLKPIVPTGRSRQAGRRLTLLHRVTSYWRSKVAQLPSQTRRITLNLWYDLTNTASVNSINVYFGIGFAPTLAVVLTLLFGVSIWPESLLCVGLPTLAIPFFVHLGPSWIERSVRGLVAVVGFGLAFVRGYLLLVLFVVVGVLCVIVVMLWTIVLLPLAVVVRKMRIDLPKGCEPRMCPHDDCGVVAMPLFLCSCGARYQDLQPNRYGLLHHVCRHPGTPSRLPTLDRLGRSKLSRLCFGCERPLPGTTSRPGNNVPILVLGGTGVGKSLIVCQAVRLLQDRIKRFGNVADLDGDPDVEDQWRYHLNHIDHGRVLAPSPDQTTRALTLTVARDRSDKTRRVQLFDIPGATATTVLTLSRKKVLQQARGLVLVVDPFEQPLLKHHARFVEPVLQPSRMKLNDVVSTLIQVVNALGGVFTTKTCPIPLAVVISKADALPGDEFDFLEELMPLKVGEPFSQDRSDRCQESLKALGAVSEINALNVTFPRIAYFACSATGRLPLQGDSRAFKPRGVVEPFLWLLDLP
jgi:hypothetical protein